MPKQVFYDPRRSRWKRVLLISNIVGVLLTLLIVFFVYSATRGIPLPELLLQEQKHPYHALKEKEKDKEKERRRLAHKRGHRKSKLAPSQVKLNAEEGIRAAFYVDWDAASFSSLREYARQIDLLFPGWRTFPPLAAGPQVSAKELNNWSESATAPRFTPVATRSRRSVR